MKDGLIPMDPSGVPEGEAVSGRATRDYRGIMALWQRESLVQRGFTALDGLHRRVSALGMDQQACEIPKTERGLFPDAMRGRKGKHPASCIFFVSAR